MKVLNEMELIKLGVRTEGETQLEDLFFILI